MNLCAQLFEDFLKSQLYFLNLLYTYFCTTSQASPKPSGKGNESLAMSQNCSKSFPKKCPQKETR